MNLSIDVEKDKCCIVEDRYDLQEKTVGLPIRLGTSHRFSFLDLIERLSPQWSETKRGLKEKAGLTL